jgi:hypothetical protein
MQINKCKLGQPVVVGGVLPLARLLPMKLPAGVGSLLGGHPVGVLPSLLVGGFIQRPPRSRVAGFFLSCPLEVN